MDERQGEAGGRAVLALKCRQEPPCSARGCPGGAGRAEPRAPQPGGRTRRPVQHPPASEDGGKAAGPPERGRASPRWASERGRGGGGGGAGGGPEAEPGGGGGQGRLGAAGLGSFGSFLGVSAARPRPGMAARMPPVLRSAALLLLLPAVLPGGGPGSAAASPAAAAASPPREPPGPCRVKTVTVSTLPVLRENDISWSGAPPPAAAAASAASSAAAADSRLLLFVRSELPGRVAVQDDLDNTELPFFTLGRCPRTCPRAPRGAPAPPGAPRARLLPRHPPPPAPHPASRRCFRAFWRCPCCLLIAFLYNYFFPLGRDFYFLFFKQGLSAAAVAGSIWERRLGAGKWWVLPPLLQLSR